MSRWFSLVGALACGCVDYEFAAMQDRGGVEGEEDGFGPVAVRDASSEPEGTGSGVVPLPTNDTGGDGGDEAGPCEVGENLTEYLDGFQVGGDDRVLFCHGTGGGGFVLVESDLSSCFPHLDHRWDVFPGTGCDS